MTMQAKRVQARDSRGRPVKGLYRRGEHWIAGYSHDGRWRTKVLDAMTLTEAKHARDSLISGLREGRVADRSTMTFAELFAESLDTRKLSDRTRAHELGLLTRHLSKVKDRPVQSLNAGDVSRVLRTMRDAGYAEWTRVAVYRVLAGTFALARVRGVIVANPMEALLAVERPKQRNAKQVRRLDAAEIERVVAAGSSERWRVALGLASYGGLRLGEIRGLRWGEVDLDANSITVSRSLLPDGTAKATKTEAGTRAVPILPALRRRLIELRLRSLCTQPTALVIATAGGRPVSERNLRRTLDVAKADAKVLVADGERLSWHSLRHSALSAFASDANLPATTLALIGGHTDPGFTYRKYARDARDAQTVTQDVLVRAAAGGFGS